MNIDHVNIRNFRKLKNCRIDFDEKQTFFVGPNNSGKTSAISAILWFLKEKNRFSAREFTLTNWATINDLGDLLLASEPIDEELLKADGWDDISPSLDLWINVSEDEAYLVNHLIPSLSWDGKMVGARVRFEPRDLKSLYTDYKEAKRKVIDLERTEEWRKTHELELFPKNLCDFLCHSSNLSKYFELKYYILDSALIPTDENIVQQTPKVTLDEDPFKTLICVDSIMAFREFSDPEGKKDNDIDTLSKQLQEYYHENSKENETVEVGDLALMNELAEANKSYDSKLQKSFEHPIEELSAINYPGFQNPSILVQSKINIEETISHESAVQFAIQGDKNLCLPEKYNGLGYRNLISIYFKLIQFRERWLEPIKNEKEIIPYIHLVFVEEPEAHLHAQAQQVFMRKAFEALENDETISKSKLATQLVVSTHSNHIVNEVDLNSLRYFRRSIDSEIHIPVSTVVNLSSTFGDDEDTRKFVTRYIRLTHCDIFFADAVVFVEGAAERMLMPKFMESNGMNKYYISVVEINGSHAYRFRPLIDKLDIYTLIITDIDAQEKIVNEDGKVKWEAVVTDKGKGYKTNNGTIKEWFKDLENIDELLDLDSSVKIVKNVRLAYQYGISIKWKPEDADVVAYPYTFEDALIFTNIDLFRGEKLKKMGPATTFYNDYLKAENLADFQSKVFKQLETKQCNKAEFANVLLYEDAFDKLQAPYYIIEGLDWLNDKLQTINVEEHAR